MYQLVFWLLLLLPGFCYSDPKFENPVLTANDLHRPSVIHVDLFYYLVSQNVSTDFTSKKRFPIRVSLDFETWSDIGYVFDESNFPVWADDVYNPVLYFSQRLREYFVFFYAFYKGEFKLGVARSTSPYEKFTPLEQFLNVSSTYDQTYPNVFETDTDAYILWVNNTGIVGKGIFLDNMTISDKPETLLIEPTLTWELDMIVAPSYFFKDGYHFLLYTNGGGCQLGGRSQSAIGVARSTEPLGPYVKMGTPFLDTTISGAWATSHGYLLSSPNLIEYIVSYGGIPIGEDHCRPPLLNADKLVFDDDNWPHVSDV